MFQGASWVTCPTTLRCHTQTPVLFHLQVSSGVEWHRKDTACLCVWPCVYIQYTEQQDTCHDVIITHIHVSLAYMLLHVLYVQGAEFLPHLPVMDSFFLSVIFYKMYVWLLDSQWKSCHTSTCQHFCVCGANTRATHWAPCYRSLIQIQNISVWPRCEQCAVSQRVREERCCVYRHSRRVPGINSL